MNLYSFENPGVDT